MRVGLIASTIRDAVRERGRVLPWPLQLSPARRQQPCHLWAKFAGYDYAPSVHGYRGLTVQAGRGGGESISRRRLNESYAARARCRPRNRPPAPRAPGAPTAPPGPAATSAGRDGRLRFDDAATRSPDSAARFPEWLPR